jgi:hypothetical protein
MSVHRVLKSLAAGWSRPIIRPGTPAANTNGETRPFRSLTPCQLKPVAAVGDHHAAKRIGMMAAQAHQKGSRKSATSPSRMKTIQNIFFCMRMIVVPRSR